LRGARRFYTGGPYERHARKAPADHSQEVAVVDLPVHEQYFFALIFELSQRTPCTARVIKNGKRVEVVRSDGEDLPDRPLTRVMRQYQVGSPESLFQKFEEMTTRPFVMNDIHALFTRKTKAEFSVSVERKPQEERIESELQRHQPQIVRA